MTDGISILIPTYNCCCVSLVDTLKKQGDSLSVAYEIIVAEDGSTASDVLQQNMEIAHKKNCRYIRNSHNMGRAAIRNFLMRQARYDRLLYIDSDMTVRLPDFLQRYIQQHADVVCGGITIAGDKETLKGNLRYLYEKSFEQENTVVKRQQNPYHDFHTANFMISRAVLSQHPFDERYRDYGYEDVRLGKTLEQTRVSILHIDAPVSFEVYEDNAAFLEKTEESLRTLFRFRHDLHDYSRLLLRTERLPKVIRKGILCWHRAMGEAEKRNLTGRHPSLLIFKFYKLGYYLSLSDYS